MVSPATIPGSQRDFCSSIGHGQQVGHDDVDDERGRRARRAGVRASALLGEDQVEAEVVDPGAAELLRNAEAERPEVAEFVKRSRGTIPARSHSA